MLPQISFYNTDFITLKFSSSLKINPTGILFKLRPSIRNSIPYTRKLTS